MDSVCRLCTNPDPNLIPLFDNSAVENEIREFIYNILLVHISFIDNRPNYVCRNCSEKVRDYKVFVNRVKESELEFQENLGEFIEEILILEETIAEEITADPPAVIDKLHEYDYSYGVEEETHEVLELEEEPKQEENIESEAESSQSSTDKSPNKSRRRKTVISRTKAKPKTSLKKKREMEDKVISEMFSFTCELCSKPLGNFKTFKRHFKEIHNQDGYIQCCDKKLRKRSHFVEHAERHTNPDSFVCEICGKKFMSQYNKRIHLDDKHVPADERKHECDTCGKRFARYTRLKYHQTLHMAEEEKQYKCDDCGTKYPNYSALTAHMRSKHSSDIYMCEICAKTYKTKESYLMHVKSHSEKAPKFQCSLCNQKYTTQAGVRRHMIRHQNETVPCPHCDKLSPNKLALKAHIQFSHKLTRSHLCQICDRGFKRLISLKEHMASHTGELLYSCQFCAKKFNSNANKYSHLKKNHTDEWENEKRAKEEKG